MKQAGVAIHYQFYLSSERNCEQHADGELQQPACQRKWRRQQRPKKRHSPLHASGHTEGQVSHRFLLSGTAAEHMCNERNDGEQQQKMDQGAGDMENQKSAQPREQENDEKYDEHLYVFLPIL
jgi:hypothetical protein